MTRLAIIVVLGLVIAAMALRYRRGVALDAAKGAASSGVEWPPVPSEYRSPGATNAWLIFTTPWCASCAQIERLLADRFPTQPTRTVDATVVVDLADRYEVQRAPTTLLLDRHGAVIERLVGPESIANFIGASAPNRVTQ